MWHCPRGGMKLSCSLDASSRETAAVTHPLSPAATAHRRRGGSRSAARTVSVVPSVGATAHREGRCVRGQPQPLWGVFDGPGCTEEGVPGSCPDGHPNGAVRGGLMWGQRDVGLWVRDPGRGVGLIRSPQRGGDCESRCGLRARRRSEQGGQGAGAALASVPLAPRQAGGAWPPPFADADAGPLLGGAPRQSRPVGETAALGVTLMSWETRRLASLRKQINKILF